MPFKDSEGMDEVVPTPTSTLAQNNLWVIAIQMTYQKSRPLRRR